MTGQTGHPPYKGCPVSGLTGGIHKILTLSNFARRQPEKEYRTMKLNNIVDAVQWPPAKQFNVEGR